MLIFNLVDRGFVFDKCEQVWNNCDVKCCKVIDEEVGGKSFMSIEFIFDEIKVEDC